MNLVNKLVLGTAQFGMDYGVNNSRGQVTPVEVNEILTESGNAGLQFIDTAYGYGNSEDVLGTSRLSILTNLRLYPNMQLKGFRQ